VALTSLQSDILAVIARNRTPETHIAGGVALNRAGPRLSSDIDIFQDPGVSVRHIAERDAADLQAEGFDVEWREQFPTFYSAWVGRTGERTRLDWPQDAAWRFFPAQPDPEFGYVLHPVDLATNKALASANRRVGRDTLDLLYADTHILPLGALVTAAVGKDPGFSPESLLNWISRTFARLPSEYADVIAPEPVDVADVSRRMHEAIERARPYVARMPSDAAGCIFLEDGVVVSPDPDRLDAYDRRTTTLGGVWPRVDETDSELLRR
jgi:hypothetical protein